MRVLIVDDHPLLRAGVARFLAERPGRYQVGEAGDADAALAALARERWDVVVLDLELPGGRDGFALFSEIRRTRPGLPVLILSVHPAREFAVRFMREGAWGYLDKERAGEDVLRALDSVARGERYIPPRVGLLLAESVAAADREPLDTLTPREMQVLRSLAGGRTLSDTAHGLGLSVKTVATYRRRLLDKLGLGNTAQLVRFAVRRGLTRD